MHSKKISHVLFALTIACSFTAAGVSFAEEDPPVQGVEAMNAKIKELEDQKAMVKAKIESLRQEKKAGGDWRKIDPQITDLSNQLITIDQEKAPYVRKLKAGERKYGKVVRDETKIEELTEQAKGWVKEMEGKTPAQQEALMEKVRLNRDEVHRLQARIKRKEKAFEKKIGEDMPERCDDTEVFNTKTRKCDPKVAPRKTLTDAEKMKLDECYTKGEALKKKVISHFSKGQEILKKNSPVIAERPIRDAFEGDVQDVINEMQASGVGKIWKVEATSYGSRVGSKTRKADDLSLCRSENALSEFFGVLAVDHGMLAAKTNDFEGKTVLPKTIEIGSKWTPGDYDVKAKQKTTPEGVKKVAQEILAGSDPTPVRATGGTPAENLEQTINNLNACCSTNQATLKYQPYQYTEMTVYGAKFTPTSEACVTKADQVANTTTAKPVESDQGTGGGAGSTKDSKGAEQAK